MQLVRINKSHKHREQTAQREQTQQVELRGGFWKEQISHEPYYFRVYKNPPPLTPVTGGWNNGMGYFFIFFAPNNVSSETWDYDNDNRNLPTENSTLYVNCCFITLLNILFFDSI